MLRELADFFRPVISSKLLHPIFTASVLGPVPDIRHHPQKPSSRWRVVCVPALATKEDLAFCLCGGHRKRKVVHRGWVWFPFDVFNGGLNRANQRFVAVLFSRAPPPGPMSYSVMWHHPASHPGEFHFALSPRVSRYVVRAGP
jgi:hypothetical protein